MDKKKNNSDTILYILTFLSIVTLVGSFATHLITGKPAFIPMDSLAGSILIGVIFFCYLCWLIYDSKLAKKISLNESINFNMKHNPVVFGMYIYWFVFIVIPILSLFL
ncbi:MAG: hypothetical protein K8S13_05860 [Desulfobacula sp.]|uniref:hypothetical protein n=1 Tax=Desulfobacula sp. TaxID=2593537 RepID=UPI0025B87568|nr:hypothetical protein [Desulfobacula sp.]MCD4719369.1 hypothetical protein [Desulfobacula sp.]